jgi:succinate dehydrogenase hydrophobic anchor subunit
MSSLDWAGVTKESMRSSRGLLNVKKQIQMSAHPRPSSNWIARRGRDRGGARWVASRSARNRRSAPRTFGKGPLWELASSHIVGTLEWGVPEAVVVIVTVVVLAGITLYLIGTMVQSIQAERRRSRLRKVWSNFGLSLAFCVLFLVSWAAHGVAEWGVYRDEQRTHGEAPTASGFVVQFGKSTLENWQSEFLQLFSFVVLASVLIHRGSAESKDSDDRMEDKLDKIMKRLDELQPEEERKGGT